MDHSSSVEYDVPTLHMVGGYASREHLNGSGPSPGLYTIANRDIPGTTIAMHPLPSGRESANR